MDTNQLHGFVAVDVTGICSVAKLAMRTHGWETADCKKVQAFDGICGLSVDYNLQ